MKPTAEPKPKRRPVELEIVTVHQYDEAACLKALRMVLAWPRKTEKTKQQVA